ncbi:MAG: hypothetical protein IPL04_13810 [Chitinophagaceae bacterium]|nr:hypothetical protein [Chitinophagaceae bacterium]
MTWNTIMGFVSSFALFIPIAIILLLKLGGYRCFVALLVYYSSVIIFNLMSEGYIPTDRAITYYWGVTNNMLDVPLMLTFLTYFSPSKKYTKRMMILAGAFVAFELIVMIVTRFSVNGLTIILGPGLIIIAGFCLQFFIRYATMAIEHRKATGKAFIAGSMLFAYGCFSILYVLFYVAKTDQVEDTFLIFFIATSISALLMSTGLIIEWKRIKKIKEIKITRKELSEMYKDTNMAAPKRTAIVNLDFDKEAWN